MSFLDSIVNSVSNAVSSVGQSIVDEVKDAGGKVPDAVKADAAGFVSQGFQLLSGAASSLIGMADDVLHDVTHPLDTISDVVGTVTAPVFDFYKGIADEGQVLASNGADVVDDLVHDVTHPGQFISDAADAVGSAPSAIADSAGAIAQGIGSVVAGGASSTEEVANDAWNDLKVLI